MAIDLKKLNDKFFTDPDWSGMEELLESYIEPFESVMNIETEGKTNDQIATEVRGRQLMLENLRKFLSDTKVVKSRIINPKPNYK